MKPIWYSSYEEKNYGDLFYALMRIYQPEKVVELGTRAGYSAYHIARALLANGHGTLDCYDLWENNIENYGIYISKSAAEENLKVFKKVITLKLHDAVSVYKKYKSVDILHVDLDNDGEILEKIVSAWIDKVRQLIIIEGGSFERDHEASKTTYRKISVSKWINGLSSKQAQSLKKMIPRKTDKTSQFVVVGGQTKYKEKPIAKWLKSFSKRHKDIEYFTIEPFPSLTILRKK